MANFKVQIGIMSERLAEGIKFRETVDVGASKKRRIKDVP